MSLKVKVKLHFIQMKFTIIKILTIINNKINSIMQWWAKQIKQSQCNPKWNLRKLASSWNKVKIEVCIIYSVMILIYKKKLYQKIILNKIYKKSCFFLI